LNGIDAANIHGDFVLLDISKENRGLAILTTHVKSSTCVENKFTLTDDALLRDGKIRAVFLFRHHSRVNMAMQ
jgi:hypothetical protein